MFGDRLCNDGHYAADKIHKKARNIQERREANRERASALLEKLKESLGLQQFLSDCEELREWIEEKMIRAQDETYRDAKTITSKFVRHQAFKSGKYLSFVRFLGNAERFSYFKTVVCCYLSF
jgi:spectrin beta